MSLYHEAASILDKAGKGQTSLKTEIFGGKKEWKTNPKVLYALVSEAAKWSEVLSEVVGVSGVLKIERQLTPTLALVLTHDLLLSKKGVALPAKHGLNALITRHKARLTAELTKTRIRKGFASIDALRSHIESAPLDLPADPSKPRHPRWIRVNTLKTSLKDQLATTFANFTHVESPIAAAASRTPALYIDAHIPNLIALSLTTDLTKSPAYREGKLIFQDKASCFPAYLLNPNDEDGDIIDATAAPGNKTTHLAAILREQSGDEATASRVFACEKDPQRSLTLEKMTKLADPEGVIKVKAKQNFLKLDPSAKEFVHVTALLLDPSCSGSGIVGRDEGGLVVHLPKVSDGEQAVGKKGKKRKRGGAETKVQPTKPVEEAPEEDEAVVEEVAESGEKDLATRLAALAEFQQRMLEHAMAFPAAKRISYSTCSVHAEENENVVVRTLASAVACKQGWRVLRRDEQVEGLQKWERRGDLDAVQACQASVPRDGSALQNAETIAQGCIRCEKGSGEGTMGFFVACFVRDANVARSDGLVEQDYLRGKGNGHENDEEDEWGGFDD